RTLVVIAARSHAGRGPSWSSLLGPTRDADPRGHRCSVPRGARTLVVIATRSHAGRGPSWSSLPGPTRDADPGGGRFLVTAWDMNRQPDASILRSENSKRKFFVVAQCEAQGLCGSGVGVLAIFGSVPGSPLSISPGHAFCET